MGILFRFGSELLLSKVKQRSYLNCTALKENELQKAWFLCPMKQLPSKNPGLQIPEDIETNGEAWRTYMFKKRPSRTCRISEFRDAILADSGKFRVVEVLGNHAIVKVLATVETLQAIAAADGINRFPKDQLNDSLSSLTTNQKDFLNTKIQALGYSLSEIRDRFGDDLGSYTLGDVIKFIAKRRKKPRYDIFTDTITADGDIINQPETLIEKLDSRV